MSFKFRLGGDVPCEIETADEAEAIHHAKSSVYHGGWEYIGFVDNGVTTKLPDDPVQLTIDNMKHFMCRHCPGRCDGQWETFFDSQQAYDSHIQSVHPSKWDRHQREMSFRCSICNYTFQDQESVSLCNDVHVRKGEAMYSCPQCNEEYGYEEHVCLLKCMQCEQVFHDSQEYLVHCEQCPSQPVS